MATKAAPSFSQRATEIGLPTLVSREQIATFGTVTWTAAEPAEARNPQTGEMGDGMLAHLTTDDGHNYQTFVGNVALLKVLGEQDSDTGEWYPRDGLFPFRARIIKSGRAWVFAD